MPTSRNPSPVPPSAPVPVRPVAAIRDGKMSLVDPGVADYEPVSHDQTWAESSHAVPLAGAMKGARLFIASKYTNQALPLVNPEAALVDSLDEDTGQSVNQTLGRKVGHRLSKIAGTVHSVADGVVNVAGADGKLVAHELHHHFPHSRKTYSHDRALVKPGDIVTAGQPIAASNYVTDDGHLALGKNLRVGFAPGPDGSTFEDAIVVSESGANKLKSSHMYGFDLEHKHGVESAKSKFVSLFPNRYTNEQLDKIGADGHAKPGAMIEPGDPVLLGYAPRILSSKDSALGNLHKVLKNSYRDLSQEWSKSTPGTVSDALKTRHGLKVNVLTEIPTRQGDKLSARSGSKGVVGKVLPDHQMYQDADGNPLDILINPLSIIGRVNPANIYEALLGKAAVKRGQPYRLPAFAQESWRDFTENELKTHGLSDKEDLINPVTGRKVPQVLTGVQYFQKLEHDAASKESGRGDGGVDQNDQAAGSKDEKAKRMGGLINTALLSHGATATLRDSALYKTGANEEMWRRIRQGQPLPAPKVPFIFDKFTESLKAGGINVTKDGSKFHLKALTDAETERLAPHELQNTETIDQKTGAPIPGGLFDFSLHGGPEGKGFSHIKLEEPLPNPLLEEPSRRFLGLTENKYRDVIAGREMLNGKTGSAAIHEALKNVDVEKIANAARDTVRSGRKSKRDEAVKLLHFAEGYKRSGLSAADGMVSRVPVLPPTYRPISNVGGMNLVSDPNLLYRDFFDARRALSLNKQDLPDHELGDEKLAVYDALRAIQGLGDPISPENQQKGVKGFMRTVAGGGGPKTGTFLSKVVGHAVNQSGRGVIVPDGELSMDEVGIPEKTAWRVYDAHVMGRMVRDGMPAAQAAMALEKKSPLAKRYLLQEMEHRPVLYSRDPSLHRYNIMSGFPRLRADNNIAISPLVAKSFGGDHDGDQMNLHLPLSDDAVAEAKEKLLPSCNLLNIKSNEAHYLPSQEFVFGATQATTPNHKKPIVTFASPADAMAAYRSGQIDIDTPIRVDPTVNAATSPSVTPAVR